MEEFFDILRTDTSLPDGSRQLPLSSEQQRSAAADGAAASGRREDVHSAALASSSNGSTNGSHSSTNGSSTSNASTSNGSHSEPALSAAGGRSTSETAGSVSDTTGASSGAAYGLRVELEDVVFGYQPERRVLKGLSLTVEPGQSVAVVGPSGAHRGSGFEHFQTFDPVLYSFCCLSLIVVVCL